MSNDDKSGSKPDSRELDKWLCGAIAASAAVVVLFSYASSLEDAAPVQVAAGRLLATTLAFVGGLVFAWVGFLAGRANIHAALVALVVALLATLAIGLKWNSVPCLDCYSDGILLRDVRRDVLPWEVSAAYVVTAASAAGTLIGKSKRLK